MDFTLTEEQTAVRDLARKILEDLATNERLKTVEATEPVFDRELWGELARANLLGAALPETHGGSGMGFFTLCVLLEEIGRAVAPISAPESLLAPLPIARFGDDALKQHWLPAVAAGEVRYRNNLPFAPQNVIGEARDVAHVDAGAHHASARRHRPQGGRHQGTDRGEDDRCVEGLGRRRVGGAGPRSTQGAGEILGLFVAGPGEGEYLAPLEAG